MKTLIASSLAVLVSVGSTAAVAGHPKYHEQAIYDRARVISAEPIVHTVRVAVPQQECYTEEVRTPVYHARSDGAALVGGIVGGVIGHRLGDGRGGATVAGTLIGAAVGKNLARHKDTYHEEVSYVDRCEVHTRYHMEERIEGYHVTYRYKGRVFTTRTDHDPGKFIPIRVNVAPAVY